MGELVQGPWQVPDAPTLTIAAVAQAESVKEDTVRRWIREGLETSAGERGQVRLNLLKVRDFRRRAA